MEELFGNQEGSKIFEDIEEAGDEEEEEEEMTEEEDSDSDEDESNCCDRHYTRALETPLGRFSLSIIQFVHFYRTQVCLVSDLWVLLSPTHTCHIPHHHVPHHHHTTPPIWSFQYCLWSYAHGIIY